MQRRIPPFLPWAPSISSFHDAWEELGEILKDKLIFSYVFSLGVFQVSICIAVYTSATAAYYAVSMWFWGKGPLNNSSITLELIVC